MVSTWKEEFCLVESDILSFAGITDRNSPDGVGGKEILSREQY